MRGRYKFFDDRPSDDLCFSFSHLPSILFLKNAKSHFICPHPHSPQRTLEEHDPLRELAVVSGGQACRS